MNITNYACIFTRDNITLALAIIGAAGTLFGGFYQWITTRKNLKIMISAIVYSTFDSQLRITVTFEDRSRLPIAVVDISLISGTQGFKATEYPDCVREYSYKENDVVIDRKLFYNLEIPADIQPLSALSGYLLFDISPSEYQTLSTPQFLQVRTTRGKEQQIELHPNNHGSQNTGLPS